MIAVDTNILVYAHRRESPWHDQAARCIRGLAEGRTGWMIPWPCLHEFLSIVTHPRIYAPPTPLPLALEQVEAWMQSPSLVVGGELASHWTTLKEAASTARVAGPSVHDARVAAICLDHGVGLLLTADRDFSKFPGLKARNPLVR